MIPKLLEYDQEVKLIENLISNLQVRLKAAKRDAQNIRAKEFININGIRRADVEMSSGDDKPWFGVIYEFTAWLKEHSKKNWAEWNHVIYRTSDLTNGRMPPNMPATIDDLTA